MKKIPTVEGVLIGLGITPAMEHFELTVEFFKTFVELRETKYKKKKMTTTCVYEEVSKRTGVNPKTIESFVRRNLNAGYKKSKFKYIFNYFNIELETGFRPSITELANLMVLVDRDRRRQETSV